MTDNDSLADRINRLAKGRRMRQDAEKQAQLTQEQINQFILSNAKPEFDRLLDRLEGRIVQVNKSLQDMPEFQFRRNGPYVRQGNSAVYLNFDQLYTNAGPIHFVLSFGREPEGVYADFFSEPPAPERYYLQPAMEHNPDRIVWMGDLGEMSSDHLCNFVLEHLTEYYLEHSPH